MHQHFRYNATLALIMVAACLAHCSADTHSCGDITVRNQSEVDEYEHCTSAGEIVVEQFAEEKLSGFNNLLSIVGITGNADNEEFDTVESIRYLDIFHSLETIKETYSLHNWYPNIKKTNPFSALKTVGGDLYLRQREPTEPNDSRFDVVPALESVGGQFELGGPSFATFGPMKKLRYIELSLAIYAENAESLPEFSNELRIDGLAGIATYCEKIPQIARELYLRQFQAKLGTRDICVDPDAPEDF